MLTRAQKRPLTEASNPHDKQTPVDNQDPGRTTKRAKPTGARSTSKAVTTSVPKAASKTKTKAVPKPKAAPKTKAAPRRKAVPKTKTSLDSNFKANINTAPPPTSPPSNPCATLTGLPVELRLHIYSYLHGTNLVHVHRHPATTTTSGERFTWTPCRGTDPSNRLLCANPKWSGTCVEEERCAFNAVTPREPRGIHALAASCRVLHGETMSLLRRCEGISIKSRNLLPWLQYMEQHAPRHLERLRRVTVEGEHSPWLDYPYPGTKDFRRRVPHLEAFAVQAQGRLRHWVQTSRGPDVTMRTDMWKLWGVFNWTRAFGADVELTTEATVHWNPRRIPIDMCNPDVTEQCITLRTRRPVLEDGGEVDINGYLICKDEDIHHETIQPRHLGAPELKANWRKWWDTPELRY